MANILDKDGLQINNDATVVDNLKTGMQNIYGLTTNFDSNTPDGELINLVAQPNIDLLEVLLQIYNNFDPGKAIGINQDNLYAINGITRQGATYSQQEIVIVTDRALTLQGLDSQATNPNGVGYTVADNVGNQWILLDTQNPSGAGTYTYIFRSKLLGPVSSSVNSITNFVNIVLGVTSINNPSGVLELGKDGETDAQFRIRQQQSTANNSVGLIDGLQGNLFNIIGVTDCKVYENRTSSTDANAIPPHCIWAIIEGGADSDIAQNIYLFLSTGCDMKGSTTYDITTIQGQIFTARFDRPTGENLYIKFNIQATKTGQSFDLDAIKAYLVDNLTYSIGQFADTSSITYQAINAINTISGSGVPLDILISINGSTWVDYLNVSTVNKKFILDVSRISITIL